METRSLVRTGAMSATAIKKITARNPSKRRRHRASVPRVHVRTAVHGQKSSEMIDDDRWCLPSNSFPTNRNYYLYLPTPPGLYSWKRNRRRSRWESCGRNSWLEADNLLKLPISIPSHFTDCINFRPCHRITQLMGCLWILVWRKVRKVFLEEENFWCTGTWDQEMPILSQVCMLLLILGIALQFFGKYVL